MNYRVRKVTFNPPTTPTITVTGVTTATVGTTVTVNATVSGAGSSYSIKWFKNSTFFSTTTLPTTTYVKGTGTDLITARVVPASAYLSCYDSVTSEGHSITGITVGVQPPTPKGELFIYPNPARSSIAVSMEGGLVNSVSITDLPGNEVIHKTGSAAVVEVSVGDLPNGIYLIKVNEVYVRRFLKE